MKKMDKFSQHEALDRTYILSINIETALGDNPIIFSVPKAKQLYEEVSKNFNELYQYLGKTINEAEKE